MSVNAQILDRNAKEGYDLGDNGPWNEDYFNRVLRQAFKKNYNIEVMLFEYMQREWEDYAPDMVSEEYLTLLATDIVKWMNAHPDWEFCDETMDDWVYLLQEGEPIDEDEDPEFVYKQTGSRYFGECAPQS